MLRCSALCPAAAYTRGSCLLGGCPNQCPPLLPAMPTGLQLTGEGRPSSRFLPGMLEGLGSSRGAVLDGTDKCLPLRAVCGLGKRQWLFELAADREVPEHPWKVVFCALCSSRLLLSALPSAGLQSLVWPFSPWAFGRRAHVSKYHRTRLAGSCLSPPQRSCKALKKKSTFLPSCLKIQQFKKREALFSPLQQPIYFLPSMLPLTSQSA